MSSDNWKTIVNAFRDAIAKDAGGKTLYFVVFLRHSNVFLLVPSTLVSKIKPFNCKNPTGYQPIQKINPMLTFNDANEITSSDRTRRKVVKGHLEACWCAYAIN